MQRLTTHDKNLTQDLIQKLGPVTPLAARYLKQEEEEREEENNTTTRHNRYAPSLAVLRKRGRLE